MSLWKKETLYFDGDEYYAEVVDKIRQAQRLITLEIYIFELDRIGLMIFHELELAAQRGVRVMMLLDAIGSHDFIRYLLNVTYSKNIRIKVYNPHPFSFQISILFYPIHLFVYMWKRLPWINKRDHRKIVTIDQELTFVGSFNFSENHSALYHGKKVWRDLGLKLEGPDIAKRLVLEIKRLWSLKEYLFYKRKIKLKNRHHPHLRLVQHIRGKRIFTKNLYQGIKSAEARVWMATAYFLPNKRIVKMLKQAALRGVDVRILISKESDIFHYPLLHTYFLKSLLESGVKIFIYHKEILHLKNYFIDDNVTMGSSNLNYRSLFHDLEVDISIQEKKNRDRLEAYFLSLQIHATEVTSESIGKMGLLEKFMSEFFYMLRYWS